MLSLETTLKVARLNDQYPPIPYVGVISDGVNRNDDEFVGNGNDISPLQQLVYHINTDPRWAQVFKQFWNAIEKEHPPGSG